MSGSILSRLASFLKDALGGESLERLDVEVEREAERIYEQTDLTRAEAVVVAADMKGYSAAEIGVSVGKSDRTIERIRRRVRKKNRQLGDTQEELDRTEQVLSDWDEKREESLNES